MALPVKLHHLPQRIAAGGFILNSGISKLSADEATTEQLYGFAVGTYPFLSKLKPKDFVRLLAATEITLGSALILPIIPSALAGAGLAGVFRRAARAVRQDAGDAQGGQPAPHPAGHSAGQGRVDAGHRPRPGPGRPDGWGLRIS